MKIFENLWPCCTPSMAGLRLQLGITCRIFEFRKKTLNVIGNLRKCTNMMEHPFFRAVDPTQGAGSTASTRSKGAGRRRRPDPRGRIDGDQTSVFVPTRAHPVLYPHAFRIGDVQDFCTSQTLIIRCLAKNANFNSSV